MTRRGFLKAIFRMTAVAPAAPVIIQKGPGWIERFLEWFQKKCRPVFRLPFIRRVFPELNAKEFVSVQPMSLPSAQVFYADFIYKGKKETYDHLPLSTDPVEPTMDWLDYKE